ncbi:LPXTG cell wall anchor domain-containing protein [Streptomyces sp. NPDC006527]|uniref:LPXTG cell wall anchor domain-containing protein n=1 Tax=Streptomyces sp. NPDC006527 TaxID=3364749 RepID=UPI0036BDC024
MRTFTRVAVAVAASSAALLLAPVAHATDTTTVQLRQDLPRTATTNDGGAPAQSHDECPGIAEDQDGWHFVLPGNDAEFVKLTVTFEPGGQQVVTDFGGFPGAEGKHAYVGSEADAKLTSAVAEIEGSVPQDLFNLSHTCPAVDEDEEEPSGSATPTDDTTTKPTDDTTTKPTDGASASPSASSGDTASPAASESATAAPTSAPSEQGGSGDLAETGNGAPVGALSAVAAVLVAAGGALLFFRRRKGQQHG